MVRKVIVRDLISLKEICSKYFDISKVYDWEKDSELLSLVKNPRIPFLQDIVNNASLYNNIFSSVLDSFIENKFEAYKYYGKNYQKLNHNEIQSLVFNFLNSYDPVNLRKLGFNILGIYM